MGAKDVAVVMATVLTGFAIVRSAHTLGTDWISRRIGAWAAPALGIAGLVAIAAGGMWHGPPHYALTSATLLAALLIAGVDRLSRHPSLRRWRGLGWAISVAMYGVLLLLIDLNRLSPFPRHVSVIGGLFAAAWLGVTLAVAPPLPRRVARAALLVGTCCAVAFLVSASKTPMRVAGYLRRQSELGTILTPVSWLRGLRSSVYLVWGNDPCPAATKQPVVVVGKPGHRNVLLITIDTLRRDFYLRGDQSIADAYPNIAAVAASGCRYEGMRSVGASTHMAMPPLYNGTLAWTTLERPLLAALADRANLHGRAYGGLQQIADYTGLPAEPIELRPSTITARMTDELERAAQEGRSWMFVAHYLDLHLPRKVELLSQFSADLRPVYRRKLADLDAELGRLFSAIKARGQWEQTIVVITADHGEELNERGYSEHAFHLYDTVLRIPFIVGLPGQTCLSAGTPMSVVDIVPMIASGLGLQIQSAALTGHWPPLDGPLFAYSTVGGPFLAIVDRDQKIIVDGRYGDTEEYDLHDDPQETRDLGGALTPAVAARVAAMKLPWNPLVPLGQRYRRAAGDEFDVCRSTIFPARPTAFREKARSSIPVRSN